MTHGPMFRRGWGEIPEPMVGVGDEGCYQLPSSQCPCVKSGCTWANVQLVWGLWSDGGRGGGVNPVHIFSRIIFLVS